MSSLPAHQTYGQLPGFQSSWSHKSTALLLEPMTALQSYTAFSKENNLYKVRRIISQFLWYRRKPQKLYLISENSYQLVPKIVLRTQRYSIGVLLVTPKNWLGFEQVCLLIELEILTTHELE
jgi:hypothetical protein